MEQKQSPTEIARRTLVQLAKDSQPPTPENYEATYNKIAGKANTSTPVSDALHKALHKAGKENKSLIPIEEKILSAIERKNWTILENALHTLLTQQTQHTTSAINWPSLIRTLLKKLETSHRGTTLSRKKDGLSRVLTNFAKDPVVLAEKIEALMQSWGNTNDVAIDIQLDSSTQEKSIPVSSVDNNVAITIDADNDNAAMQLQEMLIKTLDLALTPFLKDVPRSHKDIQDLLQELRKNPSEHALDKSARTLKNILFTVETERESQQDIHDALVALLNLLAKSMTELTIEDEWIKGQLDIVNDVLSKPVNLASITDAESSLKELIHKQANLKPALHNAQGLIKQMAETFIARLVDMTETTDEYHQKIEEHQQQLTEIDTINELNGVLKNVLDDTRMIGLTVQRTREEFHDSKAKATEAEQKIQELSSVLEYINEVANEDYLTGALNRRGMEEALEREFSRADRHDTELCIAMIDIDHFKKLNDKLGHSKGDEALAHFAKVIKGVKRSTDVLARYGGEEFIIILPNTSQNDAVKVIERVQRTLTKEFFMHSNEHVVITFSAGVAQRIDKETPLEIIPRADKALYAAKKAGRNRVLPAN